MLVTGPRLILLTFVYLALTWSPKACAQESARLGVVISDVTDAQAAELGWTSGGGVYVNSVIEETASAKAGILSKDLIVEIDGRLVKGIEEFVCLLASRKSGDVAHLTIVRSKQVRMAIVTLGQWLDDAARARFVTHYCGVTDLNDGSRNKKKERVSPTEARRDTGSLGRIGPRQMQFALHPAIAPKFP